jgi:hypothetical protein
MFKKTLIASWIMFKRETKRLKARLFLKLIYL